MGKHGRKKDKIAWKIIPPKEIKSSLFIDELIGLSTSVIPPKG